MDETRWVSREAVALAREGGDVDRRARFFARKARLMAELARIASTEGDEHDHVEQSKTRARESFARRHDEDADLVEADSTDLGGVRLWTPTHHCQDWPLCGHGEGGFP
jgi:hypothetical protein